ncbi:permease prefix domain 1-containing protein [Terribacillus saccharophilus]|uniref:permease prefix domain 1-containing protein n=1 Tax=Terribacillus saccharophilus TaxID=361277 RepID=UPI003982BFD4
MQKIDTYVEEQFADLPETEEVVTLKEEIKDSMEEKAADFMLDGKTEEDAVNKAIVDFGNLAEIKKEFLFQHKPQEAATKNKKPREDMSTLNLGFSICGSALIIGLLVFVNMYYTPNEIWFVFPTFAILWWPVSMAFVWLKARKRKVMQR